MTTDGRWTLRHDKSSSGLRLDELKRYKFLYFKYFYYTTCTQNSIQYYSSKHERHLSNLDSHVTIVYDTGPVGIQHRISVLCLHNKVNVCQITLKYIVPLELEGAKLPLYKVAG